LHGPVRAPETAEVGQAEIEMSFAAWKDANVVPSRERIVVIAPKSTFKAETVSSRLKAELVHPNKSSWLASISWSPNGRQIVAGDYPNGVIQVWDTETGKQLARIDSGNATRGSADYLQISPDWKTAFVSSTKRKISNLEKDGKQLVRWDYDGEVRSWDLETGDKRDTYKHTPTRYVWNARLSPTGKYLVTADSIGGEFEVGKRPPSAISIWDVKTKRYHSLPDLASYGLFSPDGSTYAVTLSDDEHYTTAIKLIDVTTGKEKLAIPIESKLTRVDLATYSPDGQTLIACVQSYATKGNWDKWELSLKIWDANTGREIGTMTSTESQAGFHPTLSPDGRTLAVTNFKSDEGKLFLFDVDSRKLTGTVLLGAKASVLKPAFSPNGRWIAIPTRVIPAELERDASPEDAPQPRIHLIETATATVREVIICPPSFLTKVVFSTDGQTLATDGHGNVLLWDLRKTIGTTQSP